MRSRPLVSRTDATEEDAAHDEDKDGVYALAERMDYERLLRMMPQALARLMCWRPLEIRHDGECPVH